MTLLLPIIGSLIFLVLLSFGVEALRRRPTAPRRFTGLQKFRFKRPKSSHPLHQDR